MQVFLRYRRRDVGGYSGRLVDALVQRLGARNVFHDLTTIALGEDFTRSIDRALDNCDAVLAVIGPGWLSAATPAGEARLTQPNDYVRMELSRALERGVPVIPVLVGDAALPAAADLPAEMAGLVQRQGITLQDETWHEDVDGLVRALRGEQAMPAKPIRRRLVVGGSIALLITCVAAAWFWPADDKGTDTSSRDLPTCEQPAGDGWHQIGLADNLTGVGTYESVQYTFRVLDAYWRPRQPGKWEVTLRTRMEHNGRVDGQHGAWQSDFLVAGRMEFPPSCFWVEPDKAFVKPGLVGDAVVGFQVTCEPTGSMTLTVGERASTIDLTSNRTPVPC